MISKIIEKFKDKEQLRELIWYGISGVTTTLVNVGLFYVLQKAGMQYNIANLIAIVSAKLYAFITNKYLVFRTKSESFLDACLEFFKFFIARGFTGVVDFVGVWFMVSVCGIDRMISKYVIQVVVIVLNYVLGKLFVFIKKEDKE
ncbi:MAG: GtrA family protein [Butyrivibrio sp.]|nr:GtrA family protein [Butyrivibrio sp.]